MFSIYSFVEWIVVVYYGATFYMSTNNLYYSFKHPPFERRKANIALINLILIMMITLSTSYVILQVDWILKNRAEDIGTFTDMLWIIHEYSVATIFVIVNMFISSHVKWRRKR